MSSAPDTPTQLHEHGKLGPQEMRKRSQSLMTMMNSRPSISRQERLRRSEKRRAAAGILEGRIALRIAGDDPHRQLLILRKVDQNVPVHFHQPSLAKWVA